jgi:predicted transcriptional regulator
MRYITEGEKKVDAGVGRGLLMIGVSGVWNGQKSGKLIPDWLFLPLADEKHSIVYDSDILTNPNVQMAADRKARLLQDMGAEVFITFLPDGPDGEKQGLDDFFAAGGTVRELELLTRPYDAADFARVRMSKDKKLRAAVADLWREWWSFDWTRFHGTAERPHRMRGHTCRDIAMVQIEAIARHGKVKGDEVHVSLSQRTIAERAATRQATVNKGLKHLQAEGWCEYRPAESRDKPGVYVFRAKAYQVERESIRERNVVEQTEGDTHLRGPVEVPRLRWSGPSFHREDGEIVRGYIHRLGKDLGALYDRLEREGDMTVDEAAASMNMRTRDFLVRMLPKLEEAGIECEDGVLRLAGNWREALKVERQLKGEIADEDGDPGAAEKQKINHKLQREAFRNRDKTPPAEEPPPLMGPERFARILAERAKVKLSPLAACVRDYLERCPRDACQPAGWLGSTLWALELYPGKPNPAETRDAIEELGGEVYLRMKLGQSKGAA